MQALMACLLTFVAASCDDDDDEKKVDFVEQSLGNYEAKCYIYDNDLNVLAEEKVSAKVSKKDDIVYINVDDYNFQVSALQNIDNGYLFKCKDSKDEDYKYTTNNLPDELLPTVQISSNGNYETKVVYGAYIENDGLYFAVRVYNDEEDMLLRFELSK